MKLQKEYPELAWAISSQLAKVPLQVWVDQLRACHTTERGYLFELWLCSRIWFTDDQTEHLKMADDGSHLYFYVENRRGIKDDHIITVMKKWAKENHVAYKEE